jgi:hypothetical protein
MIQVSHLAKYILNLEPQRQAESLAFYHFLKNASSLEAPLTSNIVDEFFRRALAFPTWQENRKSLAAVVQEILGRFHQEIGLPFPPQTIRPIDDYELFRLNNPKNLAQVIENHVGPWLDKQDRFRVIWDGKDLIMGIRMNAAGQVAAYLFDRWTIVRGGELVPLRNDQVLNFSPTLDLAWDAPQNFDSSPFCTARFQVIRGRATGHFIKSYTFQKSDPFELPLEQSPQIFYPLKRIESLFLNRETDPFYREIVKLLEHATRLLEQHDPESLELGQKAFEKGQIALEHVYVEERMLALLLKELARQLQITQSKYSDDRERPLEL